MRYLKVYGLGLTLAALASCSRSDEDTTKLGNWMRMADFDGDTRYEATGFVIGDTAYVGTGYGGGSLKTRLKDFYKYDPVRNQWTQIADLADVNDPDRNLARTGAVGFTSAGKGYVTTGADDNTYLNDTWEYNPASNSWTSRPAYPGRARIDAVAFTLGDEGYVGTGYSGSYESDFYAYNGNSNTWSQKNSIKDKRSKAVAFSIGDSAYVVTGTNNNQGTYTMYVYRRGDDQWYQKRQIQNIADEDYDNDYTSIARTDGAAFVIDGKAYLSTGSGASNTWEYDPVNDLWVEKTPFDGATRYGAVGFSVRNRGFITTGATSAGTYLDDTRELQPTAENVEND